MATATEQPNVTEPFILPDNLEIGQRVVVSTDPTFAHPAAGIIGGLEAQGAWILLIGGDSSHGCRFGMLEDCWYEGDPRIKTQPHLINEAELRGVFRLADTEERMMTYGKQFAAFEKTLETFIEQRRDVDKLLKSSGSDNKKLEQLEARVMKLEHAAKGK